MNQTNTLCSFKDDWRGGCYKWHSQRIRQSGGDNKVNSEHEAMMDGALGKKGVKMKIIITLGNCDRFRIKDDNKISVGIRSGPRYSYSCERVICNSVDWD